MSPPGAPGAPAFTKHSVRITMAATGSVDDYTPQRIQQIAETFASNASVPMSSVRVTVTSGSVVISAEILVNASDVVSLEERLSATLATPDAASAFLSAVDAGVTVISTPTIQSVAEDVVSYPPPPLPPVPPLSPPPSPFAPPIPTTVDGAGVTISNALSTAGKSGDTFLIVIILVLVVVVAIASLIWVRMSRPCAGGAGDEHVEKNTRSQAGRLSCTPIRQILGRRRPETATIIDVEAPSASAETPSLRPALQLSLDNHMQAAGESVGPQTQSQLKSPQSPPKSPRGSPRSPREIVLDMQGTILRDASANNRDSPSASLETPELREEIVGAVVAAIPETEGLASPAA